MYDLSRIHELLGHKLPSEEFDPDERVTTPRVVPGVTPVPSIEIPTELVSFPSDTNRVVIRDRRDGHLMDGHREWATRGPDERFWTIQEGRKASERYREVSRTIPIHHDLQFIECDSDDIGIVNHGERLRLSHHGFRSLCQRAGAPAEYLSEMPASLVTQCLNHGLASAINGSELLVTGDRVRAVLSVRYERVWNADVFRMIEQRVDLDAWRLPPGGPLWDHRKQAELEAAGKCRIATEQDCARTSLVQPGQLIVPSGCYASDHDMFVFLVNDQNRIEDGSEGGLGRGVFIRNSEVGQSSLRLTFFLYRYVCHNHVVWHASGVKEIRLRHTRGIQHKTRELSLALSQYGNSKTALEQRLIHSAKQMVLGPNEEKIVEWLFDRRLLTRGLAHRVYELARYESDLRPEIDPNSVWGLVQGITWLSQTPEFAVHADKRTELDLAAGKLMNLVS
ncbi:MAG: DUF932 domain-containing protein [Planctomyces sp.]|nr:DUF932 domain-containing protein [Planctomyces sp.]